MSANAGAAERRRGERVSASWPEEQWNWIASPAMVGWHARLVFGSPVGHPCEVCDRVRDRQEAPASGDFPKYRLQAPGRATTRAIPRTAACAGISSSGAAQESNLPSRGLHDLTGFEDKGQWFRKEPSVQPDRIVGYVTRDLMRDCDRRNGAQKDRRRSAPWEPPAVRAPSSLYFLNRQHAKSIAPRWCRGLSSPSGRRRPSGSRSGGAGPPCRSASG